MSSELVVMESSAGVPPRDIDQKLDNPISVFNGLFWGVLFELAVFAGGYLLYKWLWVR